MTLRSLAPDADVSGRQGTGSAEPMLMYLVKQVELAIRSHLDDCSAPTR